MELNAYTRDVAGLLSQKSVYHVPRFQREYSWELEEVAELWSDIENCINFKDGELDNSEYFVGTLVLIDSSSGDRFEIVDGQQRLTTITIMLSALAERFKILGEDKLFSSVYGNYIEGLDDDGNNFFKVESENHNPFFSKAIQYKEKKTLSPSNEAEQRLMNSYRYILSKTDKEIVESFFPRKRYSHERHVESLKFLRDQLTKFLKVIFIAVKEEEEAYTIFETLNARGLSLGSVDLIKNTIFKDMQYSHPDDDAKREWRVLQGKINTANSNASFEDFIRHWWISKYTYVSADNLYKAFKAAWKAKKITSRSFLDDIDIDMSSYLNIIDPKYDDFSQREDKKIFRSLQALRLFGVVQPRPFLLSLFRAKNDKKINRKQLISVLSFLESFNFKFVAICKKRSSGIEGTYSSSARKLFSAKSRPEAKQVLNEFIDQLYAKLPTESEFVDDFSSLEFTNGKTKDKRLIQYVFNKIELDENGMGELVPEDLTLEHVMSQAERKDKYLGSIGNLIPLSKELNEKAGNKSFPEKMKVYDKSSYSVTKKFYGEYKGLSAWGKEEISTRASVMAEEAYNNYWEVKPFRV